MILGEVAQEGRITPPFGPGSAKACTGALAADPGHGDQRADEQGFVVEEPGQTGAGPGVPCRKVASGKVPGP